MSTPNQVAVRDLLEEAKKRVVVLVICAVGLSYLMSLTSSSVWVNLPAAASLIIILRYLSLDFDMRKRAATSSSKSLCENIPFQNKPSKCPKVVGKSEWRRKVNSPIVEKAIDHFTRHLVSEWVTDLWYSRLTPDKEGPEELVKIINGALGEIAGRLRNINLIDLLTRDLINLLCTHLENFRSTQLKIERQQSGSCTFENIDMELRCILAAEDKLHPALFSLEAQHKVLQHLMDGLISFTLKHEDLQCLYFRYTARELLASAVMRPILNLATPRFINERIEALVVNRMKAKGFNTVQELSESKPDGSSKILSDRFTRFLDPSATGVELVQLKNGKSRTTSDIPTSDTINKNISKDPLFSIDTRSSRSGGEWGEKLEVFSCRKDRALAPEHFENMWTKGKNYTKKDDKSQINNHGHQGPLSGNLGAENHVKRVSKTNEEDTFTKLNNAHLGNTERLENPFLLTGSNISNNSPVISYQEDDEHNLMRLEETDSGSYTSYTSEDEETSNVTGLDSLETKVWDGRSIRNRGASYIHHPLENSGGHRTKKTGEAHVNYRLLPRNQSYRKRSKLGSGKVHIWTEVERTSFLSGDGQDILSPSKRLVNSDSSDDCETASFSRVHSGAAASSSASSVRTPETSNLAVTSLQNSVAVGSSFRLRCEVLGANIVRSGSRTFAIYSISVTDVNNNSWSIKRRFRHFEELHHRLKEFAEYNLHLPPKHFLSTGLDVSVVRERCKLLYEYLKKVMLLPTVSGSIEVCDFLSVDSQTYIFSNSFSIIETLSVHLCDKPAENSKKVLNSDGLEMNPSSSRSEHIGVHESMEFVSRAKSNFPANDLRLKVKDSRTQPQKSSDKSIKQETDKLEGASESLLHSATDPTLPTEWVPPNLSGPILDLVDVIFQLQDGGWIRRKAFWVAKQVLQLGMGDAFDDWLLERIQLLRKGSVIASAITRVEQILWPDGIFISKHPKRRPPPINPSQSSPHGREPYNGMSPPRVLDEQQQQEADRRAKFVYELMIDNAPSAIVGLVGRKEYEQCAKDLYFFLQSTVCLKLLAFDLLELLLSYAFPELDSIFRALKEEKDKFGEFIKAD